MILTIDIGNSNTVIGLFEKSGKLLFSSRSVTERDYTDNQYAATILDVLKQSGVGGKKIEGAVLSSVVPPVTGEFKRAILKITRINPLVVRQGMKTGLNVLIDNPSELGADLRVGAVSAIAKYPCPCIIIDMGTATKLSCINANKDFCGCVIMPGIKISMTALYEKASLLPDITIDDCPEKVIGTNSTDSMKSGIIFGSAGSIDNLIDRISIELGGAESIVATGGLAEYIIPHCRHKIIYDENLILNGLFLLYNQNC